MKPKSYKTHRNRNLSPQKRPRTSGLKPPFARQAVAPVLIQNSPTVGGWTSPIWKICNRQIGFPFPPGFGVKITNIWVVTNQSHILWNMPFGPLAHGKKLGQPCSLRLRLMCNPNQSTNSRKRWFIEPFWLGESRSQFRNLFSCSLGVTFLIAACWGDPWRRRLSQSFYVYIGYIPLLRIVGNLNSLQLFICHWVSGNNPMYWIFSNGSCQYL